MWLACFLRILAAIVRAALRSPAGLAAENVVLRHQLEIALRGRKRPRMTAIDRLTLVWLLRLWPAIGRAVVIVQPATVLRWHREAFRCYWRWKSRQRSGRPSIARELHALIRRMSTENPLWGAPRIHGELLKLGYQVAQATVAKYMVRSARPPSQGWNTFLRNHAKDIASIDLLTVPSIGFERLYAFVVLAHHRREILWIEVTGHPTACWLAQQIVEAFPWNAAPRFLLRDNDGAYGDVFCRRVAGMGIRDRPVAPHSPWQNGYVECVIGSIRRERLDHMLILGPDHLRRVLLAYAAYYNSDRTHLALAKDTPRTRAVEAEGPVVARPILGGLHHRYGRDASG